MSLLFFKRCFRDHGRMFQITIGNVMKTQHAVVILYLSNQRALKVEISLSSHTSEWAHIQRKVMNYGFLLVGRTTANHYKVLLTDLVYPTISI